MGDTGKLINYVFIALLLAAVMLTDYNRHKVKVRMQERIDQLESDLMAATATVSTQEAKIQLDGQIINAKEDQIENIFKDIRYICQTGGRLPTAVKQR